MGKIIVGLGLVFEGDGRMVMVVLEGCSHGVEGMKGMESLGWLTRSEGAFLILKHKKTF